MDDDLVDEELRPFVRSTPPPKLTVEILPEVRARLAGAVAQAPADDPLFERTERRELRVPGSGGGPAVRALGYWGATRDDVPALVLVHAGGHVLGSADMDDLLARRIVDEVGCCVVCVDYRLAPETRAPGQVRDGYAVLHWVAERASSLGIDADRIAVGGSSSGAGIAAALAQMARDQGECQVVLQALLYPMLDDRTCTVRPVSPHAGAYVWSWENNHFAWSCLLGQEPGAPTVADYAVPARAKSLAGLPPAFLAVGSLDLFLDEDLEYARRLAAAGVPVELHVYPGVPHSFLRVSGAQVTERCLRDYLAALRRAFAS